MGETATHRSGGPKRPLLRIADIFRRHRKALEAKHVLKLGQRRLLGSIVACRTPALGAQLHGCRTCQSVHPVYHSCRKRGCPNCQALAQEYLGPHIHIHVLVTAGGLLLDGSAFQNVAGLYLFSAEAMGILLRGKMMDGLRGYEAEGRFPELDDRACNELMAAIARHKSWVVYVEPPFRDPTHLLNYLGRYVHRIALSDSRLVEASPERVTFTTRDGNTASMSIDPGPRMRAPGDPVRFMHRFMHRFLQHVLPQGFHKVRHGGLYASTREAGRLDQARALLEREVDPEEAARWKRDPAETMEKLVFEGHPCPDCGGVLERTNVSIPGLRAPPGDCDA